MRTGLCIGAGLAAIAHVHALAPRTQVADEYDFVVVGGGQAGLVLGARLSEIANYTVLVLEAGTNGDEYRERIGMLRILFDTMRNALTLQILLHMLTTSRYGRHR